MPVNAPERFARTYSPRVPDDSYDSLGGGTIPDSIIRAPLEKPYEEIVVTHSLANGLLAQTLVPSGQQTRFNMLNSFASGAIQTSGIKVPLEYDNFQITTAMAGGTLQ